MLVPKEKLVNLLSPVGDSKSIKNPAEMAGMVDAHR